MAEEELMIDEDIPIDEESPDKPKRKKVDRSKKAIAERKAARERKTATSAGEKRRREIEERISEISKQIVPLTLRRMNYDVKRGSPEFAAVTAKIHELHYERKELENELGGRVVDNDAISSAIAEGKRKKSEKRAEREKKAPKAYSFS